MFRLKRYDYTFIFDLERLILCNIFDKKVIFLNFNYYKIFKEKS